MYKFRTTLEPDKVKAAGGDFDMLVGIVKNFEFTTRDDGAFDCQTILSSVGVSIIDASTPNPELIDPGQSYNISVNEDSKKTAAALETALDDKASDENKEKSNIVNINTNITLKAFISEIDRYIIRRSRKNGITSGGNMLVPNKFIGTFFFLSLLKKIY